MSSKRGHAGPVMGQGDAGRAVRFMATKVALFAILPVIVAAIVVYFTLPD